MTRSPYELWSIAGKKLPSQKGTNTKCGNVINNSGWFVGLVHEQNIMYSLNMWDSLEVNRHILT